MNEIQQQKQMDEDLFDAVKSNNTEMVKQAIRGGANVNACRNKDESMTVLRWAVSFNSNLTIIKLLLECGADPNASEEDPLLDWTIACDTRDLSTENRSFFIERIKLLMQYALIKDPNVKKPALVYDHAINNFYKESSKYWNNCKAEVEKMKNEKIGESAISLYQFIHEADTNRLVEYLSHAGFLEALKQNMEKYKSEYPIYADMIESQCRIRVINGLFAAIHNKNPYTVEKILATNEEFANATRNGINPLHHAAILGREENVILLIKYGANIDHKDSKEQTPLMYATKMGRKQVAKLLIKNGANVNATDKDGVTPLFEAIKQNDIELVNELLTSGKANPNIADLNNKTPLRYAIEQNNLGIAKALLENNVNINLGERTPLSYAFTRDYIDICALILNHAAKFKLRLSLGDLEVKDKVEGKIFLHNNRGLMNAISDKYNENFDNAGLAIMKEFIKQRENDLIIEYTNKHLDKDNKEEGRLTTKLPVTYFINFNDVQKRHIPTLESQGLARLIQDHISNELDKPEVVLHHTAKTTLLI